MSKRYLSVLGIASMVIIADQITKALAKEHLTDPLQVISYLSGWLEFRYVENDGFAFGTFAGRPAFSLAIALAAFAAVVYLLHHHRSESPSLLLAAGLVAGGAVSNLIDRLRFGFVVDFIDIGRWPVFNLADAGLTCGMILLIYGLLTAPEMGKRR